MMPLQFALERLDVLALLADHDTGTGTENRDAAFLAGRSIMTRPTEACAQLLLEKGPNLESS
jgi:hypothetical protein